MAVPHNGATVRRGVGRRTLILVVLAVLGLVVASAVYNLAAGAVLRARYPPPGASYMVGGHSMHLYCSGVESPTVLLESGLGNDWLYWQKVQPELARTTRVCSYDRAGLGWSDSQSGARDAKHIAQQLYALLRQAGEAGPLVLVGASAGAYYVRQFVAMYPEQTHALIFVDGSVPEQVQLPGREYSPIKARTVHRQAILEWIRELSGWTRIAGDCRGTVEKGLEAYAGLASAEACRLSFASLDEWDEFWNSAAQAAAAPCCRQIPVLIISQDTGRPILLARMFAIRGEPVAPCHCLSRADALTRLGLLHRSQKKALHNPRRNWGGPDGLETSAMRAERRRW
jgi:pimeloyl-ACP methyl ester carboxylesterase